MVLALPDGPAGVSGSAESTSPRRGSSGAVSSKGGTIQTWLQDHCLLRVQLKVRVSLRSLLMHVGPVFFPIPVRP